MLKSLLFALFLIGSICTSYAQMAAKWSVTNSQGKNIKMEMGKVKNVSTPIYIIESTTGDIHVELYYMNTPDQSISRSLQVLPADEEEAVHKLDLSSANERSMVSSISSQKIMELTKSKAPGTIYKVQEIIDGGGTVDVKTIFHFRLK